MNCRFHKNKEISTGGRFRFLFADDETFTLVIKNVVKEDGGKYVVKAVNEMGEAQSSCTMTVKCNFIILSVINNVYPF